jgi:uncharacterized protein YbaA (DUF1428 family)
MDYVDGFVLAVPTANKERYLAQAERAAAKFREFGALQVVECWGDEVPDGEITSFPMAVKKSADETVVFSWTIWPSKDVRDAAWSRVMTDPEMQVLMADMPLDGKRMIYGGFRTLVKA